MTTPDLASSHSKLCHLLTYALSLGPKKGWGWNRILRSVSLTEDYKYRGDSLEVNPAAFFNNSLRFQNFIKVTPWTCWLVESLQALPPQLVIITLLTLYENFITTLCNTLENPLLSKAVWLCRIVDVLCSPCGKYLQSHLLLPGASLVSEALSLRILHTLWSHQVCLTSKFLSPHLSSRCIFWNSWIYSDS